MNVYMHICLDVILQRKWAVLSLGQQVSIRPHVFNPQQDYLGAMVVEVDFLMKKKFVASYGCAVFHEFGYIRIKKVQERLC